MRIGTGARLVVPAVVAVGCWQAGYQARQQRVWEMQDHDDDLRDAREAIRRGDLASARRAGARLGEPDPVPGLPAAATRHLDALRADGRALAEVTEPSSAATALTAMTAHCAACHRELAVAAPAPLVDSADEHLWLGLVFESDPHWSAGLAALPPGSGVAGESWDERRHAMARRLVADDAP